MANYEFLDPSTINDPISALELRSNAIRRALQFDRFETGTMFEAIVLTRPIFLADVTTEGTTTVFGRASRDTGRLTKFAFKGRIITKDSPHDYLPNPCDAAATTDAEKRGARRLVSLHTTFISSDDYTKNNNYLPEVGDIVRVRLSESMFSYDLQFGSFVSVKDNRANVEASDEDALNCSSVKDLFADISAASTRDRTGTTTSSGYIRPVSTSTATPSAAGTTGTTSSGLPMTSMPDPTSVTIDSNIVLVGDSQIADGNPAGLSGGSPDHHPTQGHGFKGHLGRALQAKYGIQEQHYHGSRGWTAARWNTDGWSDLQSSLSTCPATIIISLGGNGTAGAQTLIDKIRGECPDIRIVWSGPPPRQDAGRNATRSANNEIIRAIVEATENATFVDAFGFIKNTAGQPGYDDTSGDGLHLTSGVARAYVIAAFS